jgi:hypothetical protein
MINDNQRFYAESRAAVDVVGMNYPWNHSIVAGAGKIDAVVPAKSDGGSNESRAHEDSINSGPDWLCNL